MEQKKNLRKQDEIDLVELFFAFAINYGPSFWQLSWGRGLPGPSASLY